MSGGGWLDTMMARAHAPIYAARLREIVRCITPHLLEGDRVLDVGCGSGVLGKTLLASPGCPAKVQVNGLEQQGQEHRLTEGEVYDGRTMPYPAKTFDVVILADVLHHEPEPDRLLAECIRVSRRLLIIKDHQVQGVWARQRLAFLDWAANIPYGVPCLYQYLSPGQWEALHRRHALVVEQELTSMRLYPVGLNLFFGGGLHYFAIFRVPETTRQTSQNQAERSVSVST